MFRKLKSLVNYLLVICLIFSALSYAGAAASAATLRQNRLAGDDRYLTAVTISQSGWLSSDNVILATEENFPDALCAAPLASLLNSPILLTEKAVLNTYTGNEIKRLGAKNIILVGGAGVISQSVEDSLKADGMNVKRLWGSDRYETSVEIAKYIKNNFQTSSEFAVATGEDFPDALSISPVAAQKKMIILLTPKDSIPDCVKAFVSNGGFTKTYVMGGRDIIIDSTVASFPEVERIYGKDKYERNAAVIDRFSQDLNFDTVYIATGEGYPDALAGSVLASKTCSPVFLTSINPKEITWNAIDSIRSSLNRIVTLGGEGVVPSGSMQSLTALTYSNNNISAGLIENRKLYDNIYVTANYNVDFLFLSAAVGSNLTHPGYYPSSDENVAGNSNPIIQNMKSYFSKYTNSASAKQLWNIDLNDVIARNSVFNNLPVEVMIEYDQFLKNSMLYNGPERNSRLFQNSRMTVNEFKNLLDQFSNETDANVFFIKNRELYEKMLDDYTEEYNFNYVNRLQEFFNVANMSGKFQIILSPTIGGGQAMNMVDNSGDETYINVMNPINGYSYTLNVLYHETAHNFIETFLEEYNNRKLLEKYSGYSDALGESYDFESQVNETLARVVTIAMLEKYHGKTMAYQNMKTELDGGWKNLDNIYFLVKNKYMADRGKYPTFESFLPVILEYIKSASLGQPFDVGPKEDIDQFPSSALILGNQAEVEKFANIEGTGGYLTVVDMTDQSKLDNSGMIVLFDYPGLPQKPQCVSELFDDMGGSSKNFVDIKTKNDKLLIYIKGESQEKVLEIIDKLSNIYSERYETFN